MYMVSLAVPGKLIVSPLEMKEPGRDPICISADGRPKARVRSQVLRKVVESEDNVTATFLCDPEPSVTPGCRRSW